MPDTEAITTVVPASPAPEQGAPQATEQNGQPPVQPQSGTPVQVETGTKLQPGNEVRPFERVAGRKLDKLERGFEKIREMLESLSQPTPSPSAKTPITAEEFLGDPITHMNRLRDEIREELRGEIPKTLSEQAKGLEFKRSQQDALKMIETNEMIGKDPEGIKRIEDILNDQEYGLEEIASKYPLYAAKMALKIYQSQYGSTKAVSAPTKAQMSSTATAIHPSGKVTLKDEAVELQKQFLANPDLRHDPEFMKKLQALKEKRQAEVA